MNKFFNEYVDLTALILTFLLPLVLVLLIKRKEGRKTRAVPAYFLLFGPSGTLVFIFFHLFENSYHAIAAAATGVFTYNFHFYSLILLGVVVACIGYFLLRACWYKCIRQGYGNRVIFQFMLLLSIVILPLIPITPLSAVPLICCVFSMLGLPFARRRIKRIPIIQIQEETEIKQVAEDY